MKKIPKKLIPQLLSGARPFSVVELTRQEIRVPIESYGIFYEDSIDSIISKLTEIKKKHPGEKLLFEPIAFDYEGYEGSIDIYSIRYENDEEVASRLNTIARYKNLYQLRKRKG